MAETKPISTEDYLKFFKEMEKLCKENDYENNQVVALVRFVPANCCSCPMLAGNKKPRCFVTNKFVSPKKRPASCPIREVK